MSIQIILPGPGPFCFGCLRNHPVSESGACEVCGRMVHLPCVMGRFGIPVCGACAIKLGISLDAAQVTKYSIEESYPWPR